MFQSHKTLTLCKNKTNHILLTIATNLLLLQLIDIIMNNIAQPIFKCEIGYQ